MESKKNNFNIIESGSGVFGFVICSIPTILASVSGSVSVCHEMFVVFCTPHMSFNNSLNNLMYRLS